MGKGNDGWEQDGRPRDGAAGHWDDGHRKGDDGTDRITTLAVGAAARGRYRPLAELRAYWEALRAGRRVPARAEVDPRGIEGALEYAFILERVAPGAARFRVCGMHLNDLMGMEVRGMPFGALFTPRARAGLADRLEAVFATPAAAELRLSGETGFGRPALAARCLILPLRSDLGDVTRALGCLVSEGRMGRTPRRFDIEAALVGALSGTDPESAPPRLSQQPPLPPTGAGEGPATAARGAPVSAQAPGMAEPGAVFHPAYRPPPPALSPAARRAMFRLVKGADVHAED